MTEFEKYYEEISGYYRDAVDNGNCHFTKNTDHLHNAAIMLLMLENGRHLRMYCGRMSIFKNRFYGYIPEESNPEEIKERIARAFEKFITTPGNRAEIVLQYGCKGLTDDLIFSADLLKLDNVELYKVPDVVRDKSDIDHYSFIDDGGIVYRLETDPELHRALCKIGESDDIGSPLNTFNKLRSFSYIVNVATC